MALVDSTAPPSASPTQTSTRTVTPYDRRDGHLDPAAARNAHTGCRAGMFGRLLGAARSPQRARAVSLLRLCSDRSRALPALGKEAGAGRGCAGGSSWLRLLGLRTFLVLRADGPALAQEPVTVLADSVFLLRTTLTGAHADSEGISTLRSSQVPCTAHPPSRWSSPWCSRSNRRLPAPLPLRSTESMRLSLSRCLPRARDGFGAR